MRIKIISKLKEQWAIPALPDEPAQYTEHVLYTVEPVTLQFNQH